MIRKRKAVIVIQDGVGDRPISKLGGKTPLEVASIPNIDLIASKGITGLMDPVAPGVRVGTDVGHLALFGYDPYEAYSGRGPIEAAGLGLDVKSGDVLFRCNFATVDENFIVIDRRAGRIREGTEELAAALDGLTLSDGTRVVFKEATEHRAVLILRGENLSAEITDSDPLAKHEGEKVKNVRPLLESLSAHHTAKLVDEFIQKSYEILKNHPVNLKRIKSGKMPANVIITRSAGAVPRIQKVSSKYKIRGACIVGESTVAGVARLAGFEVFTSPKMTAGLDTDTIEKANYAIKALKDGYDIVYVHIKGPDIAGHDDKPFDKVKIIEKVDIMVGRIIENVNHEIYIALTSDHATPCEVGDHSGDPVPVLIYGPDVCIDDVIKFNERACAKGGLGRINARGFMMTIFDLMGITEKYGS